MTTKTDLQDCRVGIECFKFAVNFLLKLPNWSNDLKFFVLDSKIDVLAINETKIDSSVNDNEIYLPGFEVVRKDRSVNGRSGGGVCIYLRSNINYQIRDDLCDDHLECVVVEIIRPHSKPFIVSTWYKPPNSPQDIFRQFESLIDKVDSEQKDFYFFWTERLLLQRAR